MIGILAAVLRLIAPEGGIIGAAPGINAIGEAFSLLSHAAGSGRRSRSGPNCSRAAHGVPSAAAPVDHERQGAPFPPGEPPRRC